MGKKADLMREALTRQGRTISCNGRTVQISGGSSHAEFESGSEGVVHLATEINSGEKYRIKCFYNPDELRRRRSEFLVRQQLANLKKYKADALGGAPTEILSNLGPLTPFALVMRNVQGESWRKLKMRAQGEDEYPPAWWPPVSIRATWAYGLATAVKHMEEREFVHADLSVGNVVVSDGIHGVNLAKGRSEIGDDYSGDMALVDFDRYVHKGVELPEAGKGSKGYAAKEVWEGERPVLGSDRTSMAILIQEFIVIGDSDLSREDAYEWSYDQEDRAFEFVSSSGKTGKSGQPKVHPLLAKKYPSLAALVEDTIRAAEPVGRPEPQKWRDVTRDIVGVSPAPVPLSAGPKYIQVTVEEVTKGGVPYRLSLGAAMRMLDLSETKFRIRGSLKRDPGGSIYLAVHEGAALDVKHPGRSEWVVYTGNARVDVQDGMEVIDKSGVKGARLLGRR
jgi:hypothetical protein